MSQEMEDLKCFKQKINSQPQISPNVPSLLEFTSYVYTNNNIIGMVEKHGAEIENRCEDLMPAQYMFQGELCLSGLLSWMLWQLESTFEYISSQHIIILD